MNATQNFATGRECKKVLQRKNKFELMTSTYLKTLRFCQAISQLLYLSKMFQKMLTLALQENWIMAVLITGKTV